MAMINLRSVQVILTFTGGDMDGVVIDTFNATDREMMLADNFMTDSNCFEIGKVVKSAPLSASLTDQGVANYLVGLKQRMDAQITELPAKCYAYRVIAKDIVGRAVHFHIKHLMVDND